jgi:23S rRNA (cytidine1920-2'-O)/16S rRNA (cytidine1409-2'-O)-methyltransferase
MALIKPQFEAGKGAVGKGGVVRDPRQHEAIIKNLTFFFRDMDLDSRGLVPSPVLGPKGNREFLILLRNRDKTTSTTIPRKAITCDFSPALNINSCVAQA